MLPVPHAVGWAGPVNHNLRMSSQLEKQKKTCASSSVQRPTSHQPPPRPPMARARGTTASLAASVALGALLAVVAPTAQALVLAGTCASTADARAARRSPHRGSRTCRSRGCHAGWRRARRCTARAARPNYVRPIRGGKEPAWKRLAFARKPFIYFVRVLLCRVWNYNTLRSIAMHSPRLYTSKYESSLGGSSPNSNGLLLPPTLSVASLLTLLLGGVHILY